MQIKSTIFKSLLIAISLLCITGKAAAQQPLSELEQALKDTGWSVQQEQDGSLILKSGASAKNSIKKKNVTKDNWSKMQRELQAAGWTVNREADGTLVLFPQATASPETVPQIKPMIDADMQQKLREAGWSITKKSGGSVLLYPPEKSSTTQPLASPGIPPSVALSLPVDNWQEAYDISQSWLDRQPPYRAAVGKIRKVLRIYVVSIVSEKAPYTLLQQIAIRSSDGAVIVLN